MTPSSNKQKTVLIVDDDPISLAVASLMVESEGYAVLQADGGNAALELVEKLDPAERPAAILIDLQMPGISGPNLAALLRSTLPGITAIGMSATLPEDVHGFDMLLQKPLVPASLKEALEGNQAGVAQSRHTMQPKVILDETVYSKLERSMSIPSLREVYMACVHDTRIRIANMRVALLEHDLARIRSEAHAIKGGAGMVGASQLSHDSSYIETGEYNGDHLPELLDNLLCRCDELERMLFSKWQS